MKQPASRYINQIVSFREQKVSWADIAKKLRMSTHVSFKVPSLQMAFYNHRDKAGKSSKLKKVVKHDTKLLVKALSGAASVSTTELIKRLLKVETEAQTILQELRSRV